MKVLNKHLGMIKDVVLFAMPDGFICFYFWQAFVMTQGPHGSVSLLGFLCPLNGT